MAGRVERGEGGDIGTEDRFVYELNAQQYWASILVQTVSNKRFGKRDGMDVQDT